MELDHQRHDEQRHDVDDLDQRVDGGAGGVFVGVAHGVARHGGLVRFRSLAAVVAVFDVLLGVVPGAAARAHRNRHEQAGDDGAHQQAAQRLGAQQQAHHNGYHHGQQAGDHHLFDGGSGQHVHGLAVLGLAGAVHDAGNGVELAAHLHHHGACRAAHGLHRHGAKQVRNQPADEQANDDQRVRQVERDGPAVAFELVGVVRKQHQRSQSCRANGVALGHGLGGVAHGVQRVGDVAHAAGQLGHFGNAAGVVGDGAVSIERHHDTGHGQHRHRRHGNAIQARQLVGHQDGQAHKNHRPGGGAHGNAQARNDVGAMARGGGLCDVAHGGILRAGIELGDPHQRGRQHQPGGAGAKQLHLAAAGGDGVVRNDPQRDEVERDERQHAGDGQALVQRGHHVLHAGGCLHKEAANDGRDDGHRPQCQGVHHCVDRGGAHHQCTQHHGGNQRHRIGLEQVGRHAGAVAHVVAHVVGNHRGVAGVVFRNARLDLAHQIGAHVGTLGEDAAAQAREDGDERRAKRKADQRIEQRGQFGGGCEVAIAGQKPVKRRDTEQPQPHHQHAGDGAAAKSHVERRADAARGCLRCAHVGAHRDIHADEAAGTREHGPHHKADGRRPVKENANQHRQHHAHEGNGLVLARQVSRRAGLNGCRNFLHARIAGVFAKNPAPRPDAVGHGDQPADQGQ